MAAVTVRFGTEQATAALDELGRAGQVALRRSLRRTAASVRAVMASAVATDVGLRVGTVRDEIRLRIDEEAIAARISVSGARIPLEEFSANGPLPSRGRGRGVTARIGGVRKRYVGAFRARLRSGHVGVFTRTASSTRKSVGAWSKNLPIRQLFGPSLPHVFDKHVPMGLQHAEDVLAKNLTHEFSFALSRVTA
jgi:hypothetical protein